MGFMARLTFSLFRRRVEVDLLPFEGKQVFMARMTQSHPRTIEEPLYPRPVGVMALDTPSFPHRLVHMCLSRHPFLHVLMARVTKPSAQGL